MRLKIYFKLIIKLVAFLIFFIATPLFWIFHIIEIIIENYDNEEFLENYWGYLLKISIKINNLKI